MIQPNREGVHLLYCSTLKHVINRPQYLILNLKAKTTPWSKEFLTFEVGVNRWGASRRSGQHDEKLKMNLVKNWFGGRREEAVVGLAEAGDDEVDTPNNREVENTEMREAIPFPLQPSLPISRLNHHHHHQQRCSPPSFRIAVVGDVHDDWDLELDSKALHFLQPDVVLFTGDFGNENVELVRSIADLKMPKAAILGNHDTWHTHRFSHKVKDRVQLQLDCLGEEHVGYKHLDFPELKLSIVGGRPFSCGGNQLYRKKLLIERYGVSGMEESANRIHSAATKAPVDHSIILLAHNGPTGLGSNADDLCGKDWVYGGGDHGDPDLARAISLVKETSNYPIPLVVFGHMHKDLACGGFRKMMTVGPDNAMYLNGAIVPRVKHPGSGGSVRGFTTVEFSGATVLKVSEVWVLVIDDETSLKEESVMFQQHPAPGRSMY